MHSFGPETSVSPGSQMGCGPSHTCEQKIVTPQAVTSLHPVFVGQCLSGVEPGGQTGRPSHCASLGPVHQIVCPHFDRA